MIVVTGATGMFGSRVVRELSAAAHPVRALTRNPDQAGALQAPGVELVRADLDDPTSVAAALEGATRVFLVSPMHPKLAEREVAVVEAARAAGVSHLVKLYGAVEHGDDELNRWHLTSIAALKASGVPWTLVSPGTVLESNLFSHAETIRTEHCFYGCVGEGRVSMVAADDVARVAAKVLTGSIPEHQGQNYEITGDRAVTFTELAECLTQVLGRTIRYIDMDEREFTDLLVEATALTPEQIEVEILCHYRAFRQGCAAKVTDTYRQLMDRPPVTLEAFLQAHRQQFV